MKHWMILIFLLALSILPLASADCNGNTTTCNALNNTLTCSAQPGCFWTPTNNADNGFNHLSMALILISLAALFVFVGNTIEQRKWLMKSSMYFTALLIMLIATNFGMQIAETSNLNKTMYLSFLVGIIAFSVFLAFIFINYLIQITRAVKEVNEERKTQID